MDPDSTTDADPNPPPLQHLPPADLDADTSSLSQRRHLLRTTTSSSSSRALGAPVCDDATVYTDAEALSWVTDTARALAYLHSQRPAIVHRDVKTENILLTKAALHLPRGVARGAAVTLASVFKPVVLGGGCEELGENCTDTGVKLPEPRRAKLADFGLHVVGAAVCVCDPCLQRAVGFRCVQSRFRASLCSQVHASSGPGHACL